jgi:hypothetical protein
MGSAAGSRAGSRTGPRGCTLSGFTQPGDIHAAFGVSLVLSVTLDNLLTSARFHATRTSKSSYGPGNMACNGGLLLTTNSS